MPAHETDGIHNEEEDVWNLTGGRRIPHSLSANICDCIKDFANCPNCSDLPEHVDYFLHRLLRGVMDYIGLRCPSDPGAVPNGVPPQWRFLTVSAAQNEKMFKLLRRYAPLFPQASDREPHVPVEAVWKGRPGKRPRDVLAPPLLESVFNMFMCIDKSNTDRHQECWEWCEPTLDPSLLAEMGLADHDPSAHRGDEEDETDE